jgi:hypothetical protein
MKDASVKIHTTEENERWLIQRTEDLNCSVSEYVHELIQKHIDIISDDQDDQYDSSKRLRTVVEAVYDETEILLGEFWGETTRESDGMHRPDRLQLIVLWKLLADEYSDADRQYAMQLAHDYVGEELDLPPEGSSTDRRWDETPSEEGLTAGDFMTGDTGWEPDGSTDEQDTTESVDPSDFITGNWMGDSDE